MFEFLRLSPQLGLRTLRDSCRRMGRSLDAGIDIRKVCATEATSGPADYRRVMRQISQQVDLGEPFSEAVRRQSRSFPYLYMAMMVVGDRTGKLPEVLLRVADHYEHLAHLRQTLLVSIARPLLQFVAAIAIVGFLIWLMGPLSSFVGSRVDILGFGLIGNSGLILYLGFWVAVVVGIRFLLVHLKRNARLAQTIRRRVMAIPVIGNALVTQDMARMCWSLSLLADTSMSSRMIARTVLESSDSSYYLVHKDVVDARLKQGSELHEAFRDTHAFPDDFLQALETGEMSGTLVDTMKHLSRDYLDRSRTAWSALTVAVGFAIWALVSIVLIFMIFRLAMSYIGTIQSFL